MPDDSRSWPACLTDAFLGVAFFDGIRIDTDRITDPRWDRVLPILEEEQVFMCRAMLERGLLKPGLRVLDVGTGSGVFAIWAAAHGCRVTALDRSPRALRFTQHNRTYPPNADLIRSQGGSIETFEADFLQWANTTSDLFDIVILSPPYNPTAPDFVPASHANAGLLGQDRFYEQLPLAWKLLRDGGTIVGNQMGCHARGAVSDWWRQQIVRLTESKSGSACSVTFMPILKPAEHSVRAFLEAQYSVFLNPLLNLTPSAEEIRNYIEGVLRPDSTQLTFGLYYYELFKNTAIAHSESDVKQIQLGFQTPSTWKHRVELHRRIIEHTGGGISVSSPGLFLRNEFTPPLPSRRSAVETGSSTRQSFISSPLSSLSKWIVQSQILSDSVRPLFDLIVIDVGPWFDAWEGRQGLYQEALLCVCNDVVESPVDLLAAYQRNTIAQQECCLGPFLHPSFTGSKDPNEWRQFQYHVIDHSTHARLEHNQEEDNRRVARWRQNLSEQFERTVGTSLTPHSIDPGMTPGYTAAFVTESLAELRVPDVRAYWKRIEADYPNVPHTSQLLKKDLDFVHITFHQRLRQLLTYTLKGTAHSRSHTFTSGLIGLPFSLAFAEPPHSKSALPTHFRGGLWVYAATRGRIGPREESYLLDLTRLCSLLMESSITASATETLVSSLRSSYHFNLAHEIRALIDGIHPDTGVFDLDLLQAYFRLLAVSPREFDTAITPDDRVRLWHSLQKKCLPGFASGATLSEFVTNHFAIACKVEGLLDRVNGNTDTSREEQVTISIESGESQLADDFLMAPECASPQNLKCRVFFGLALIAAFRNLWWKCSDEEPVMIVANRGRISIVNRRESDQIGLRGGTRSVLTNFAREYFGPAPAIGFAALSENPTHWETSIPLPIGFLANDT